MGRTVIESVAERCGAGYLEERERGSNTTIEKITQ
jgi:hypothetical protein